MAELSIILADGRRRSLRLRSQQVLAGRDETNCDLVLDDPTCSRRHFRVHATGPGTFLLEDLHSHNGTFVNGRRVQDHHLRHGDEIQAGRCTITFYDVPETPATTLVLRDGEDDLGDVSVYRQKPSVTESRLAQLLDLTSRMVGAFERRDLLERAMDICIETLHFERGLIVESAGPRGEWHTTVIRNVRRGPADAELTVSRSILARAIQRGERSIINNDLEADMTQSMVEHRIRSAMCVPITWQDQILGALYGDSVKTGEEYTEEDINFLAGLAAQIGAALKTSQLVEQEHRRIQMENDLTIARQIQEGLFPHDLPRCEGVRVMAYNSPGRNVSGDYYDVIPLGPKRLAAVIADVSGNGVAAAMLMANLQAAVRVTLPETDNLTTVVRRLNTLVCDNAIEGRFITGLICIVDLERRTLSYVSAGHYPPYRVTLDGRIETLPLQPGLPLGVEHDADYPIVDLALGPEGCSLFLFTDGVPESLNAQDEFFGLGRIETLLQRHAQAQPAELVASFRRTLGEFTGHTLHSDDMTLMAIRVEPA